jgi:hypothetical protein
MPGFICKTKDIRGSVAGLPSSAASLRREGQGRTTKQKNFQKTTATTNMMMIIIMILWSCKIFLDKVLDLQFIHCVILM